MKKILCLGAAILMVASSLHAQSAAAQKDRFTVSLQGGVLYNLYENEFSYRENDAFGDLFTLEGAVAVGYDISETFGVRLQGAFGKDAGAGNVRETAGNGFYPYNFKNVNVFADAVLNLYGLAGRLTAFRPKLYAGVGFGHTFSFTDPHHPWQKLTDPNTVFGFRFGAIAEYNLTDHFGLYADLSGEAFTDKYNGLMPNDKEQEWYEGYGGFPLDLRGILSFGVLYRF